MKAKSALNRKHSTKVVEDDLDQDIVHVWYAWIDTIDPNTLQNQLSILSPDEVKRYQGLYFPYDRHRFLTAHLLKRFTLSKYLKTDPDLIEFSSDRLGKPELRYSLNQSAIQFNLTHTHNLVSCAIARRRVGIDAEFLDRTLSQNTIAMFLSNDELELINRRDNADRTKCALDLWTLKEAYLKGIGVGLHRDPKDFSFHRFVSCEQLNRQFQAMFEPSQVEWTFFQEHKLFEGYVMSSAIESANRSNAIETVTNQSEIRYFEGTALLQ